MSLGLARENPPREARPPKKNAQAAPARVAKARTAAERTVIERTARPRTGPNRAAKPAVNPLSEEFSLEDAWRLREQHSRQQAEAEREKKRQTDLERRRLNDAIRDIVMPRRLNDDTAELTRNFLYRGRIRKVRVNPEQLKGLNEGSLGLVYLSGSYHVLASEWVKAVAELSVDHVPDLSGGAAEQSAGDDEFPVPDDLVW